MASRPRITIIGTGFVGTSIGLGLMKARGQEGKFEIVGHDRSAPAANAAKKRNAVDRTDWNLISAVDGADLVFLAIPVQAVRETLALIGSHLKTGAIVTDTAGTKGQVMQWAKETLPPTVNFIGGDPMLGREGAPVETASAEVLANATYCLTPAPTADPDAIRILSDFISGMGAQPYFVDPDEHDGVASLAAHMPFVLSLALLNAARRSPSWAEVEKMAGDNFKIAAATTATDPMHWQGLATTNAASLSRSIDAVMAELEALRGVIGSGDEAQVEQALTQARETSLKLMKANQTEDNPLEDIGRDRFRQIFFGSIGSKKRDR